MHHVLTREAESSWSERSNTTASSTFPESFGLSGVSCNLMLPISMHMQVVVLSTFFCACLTAHSHKFKHPPSYRAERRKYYNHREKSRRDPRKYVTVIIDGMDQNKTNFPHLINNTKSTHNLWRLRTHLTGVLVHTQALKGKLVYGFYDLMQLPHDCNLTIHVLLEALLDFSSLNGALPEVLYLQLDNCFRENKNNIYFHSVHF